MKNSFAYLERTAARVPDKTAFTDESGSVTFAELLRRANAVGTMLTRRNIALRQPVAVLVGRDTASVVALLGVLAAGCCYAPIDADTPTARLEKILRTLSPAAILSRDGAELPTDAPIIAFDSAFSEFPDTALLAERRAAVLDVDPAYIIHTSGSTGDPKGIVVPHRALIDFCDWMADALSLDETCVFANQAPFFFDLSVKDLYMTLKLGATAHIMPRQLFMFPAKLVDWLGEHSVNTLCWATSAFNLVANSGILAIQAPDTLRSVILGGETLYATPLNIWRRALPECRFINLYGPTETTVDCAYYIVDREYDNGDVVPIGRACENMEIMLLDEHLQLVADGERGEICVRGTGLALGYYGDGDKTRRAFVQNPRNAHYPDLIYRTGDYAYVRDGLLVFASRLDGQIKRGGYRIELGEIERALTTISGVDNAVCVYDEVSERVTCHYDGTADERAVAGALRGALPKYMLPNAYTRHDALPRTANGKLDRKTLRGVV
ncbi:MAG: amino acid adenylation domain-containing protein [Oscillospiraceae bacterium]|nr:amino acid adenylation domain-containing protein [Oscillospiraceae bacterium]